MKNALIFLVVTFCVLVAFGHTPSEYHTQSECAKVSQQKIIFFDGSVSGDGYEAKRDFAATCSDLAAQWSVADKTHRGFWIGLVGLTFLGLTLIETRNASSSAANTLLVAQKTLAETKKSTRLEMQPYLSCEDVLLTGEGIGHNEIILKGVAKIKNNGKTPANIRWCINNTMANFGPYNADKNRRPNSRQFLYVAGGSTEKLNLVFNFKFSKDGGKALDYSNLHIRGHILVGYLDEFSAKGKENVACFSFFSSDNPKLVDGEGVYLNIKSTDPIDIRDRKGWEELKDYNSYQ